MKVFFIKDENEDFESRKPFKIYLPIILREEEEIKDIINRNYIKHYKKILIPGLDEYVTTCGNKESLYPKNYLETRAEIRAKGITFQVKEIRTIKDTIAVYDLTGIGYYLEGVRMATEKEINKIKYDV